MFIDSNVLGTVGKKTQSLIGNKASMLITSEYVLKLNFRFFFFFFFFFLIFQLIFCFFLVAFWGCIEHTFNKRTQKKKKIKKKKKVGSSWDLNQGPLKLASDALPTELRGPSLQGNS